MERFEMEEMIKTILTIGDDKLLQKSTPILDHEFDSKELSQLITNLYETQKYNIGVGIAAPQIGILKQVITIEYGGDEARYKDIGSYPFTAIINPTIYAIGSEVTEYNEGCLSVPDVRAIIKRPKKIYYKFFNQFGKVIEGEADGFFARVLQHEYDHLQGILFPSRMDPLSD